jgi:hypothetical protein
MADRGIQLANAIVAAIQDGSWAVAYTASREWNPNIALADDALSQCVVWVVPKDDDTQYIGGGGPSGACTQQQDLVCYVITQFRPLDPNPATAVDAAADLAAAQHEALKQQFLTLDDGATAKWQKSLSTGHDFAAANKGVYRKEFETHWRVIG